MEGAGRSLAQVSEETLLIQAWLCEQLPGTRWTYTEIESCTGVQMDMKGKERLRSAARRAQVEYACIPGRGIELASPDNGVQILAGKLSRMYTAVKRGDRCHRNIQEKFQDGMTAENKQQMLLVGAAFGAIRAATEGGRRLYAPRKIAGAIQASIPVPDV